MHLVLHHTDKQNTQKQFAVLYYQLNNSQSSFVDSSLDVFYLEATPRSEEAREKR